MNKIWVDASHNGILYAKTDDGSNLKLVRELDAVGLFETSWMTFKHYDSRNKKYGYPK